MARTKVSLFGKELPKGVSRIMHTSNLVARRAIKESQVEEKRSTIFSISSISHSLLINPCTNLLLMLSGEAFGNQKLGKKGGFLINCGCDVWVGGFDTMGVQQKCKRMKDINGRVSTHH